MHRVKIIATIGPRTCSADSLRALEYAGMDVVRLNGSHGDVQWHAQALDLVRNAVPNVPVLLDLPGNKIRLGVLHEKRTVAAGETVVLTCEPGHDGREKVPVNYPHLWREVEPGKVIMIDDASLRLTVAGVSGRDVICHAETSGTLRSAKGVNIPGLAFCNSGTVPDRDRALISLAREKRAEFIGISFVMSSEHVQTVRELVRGSCPQVVSKIETQLGLDAVDEIVHASDAVMIDRGDLSVETNLEGVALLQKRIIARAHRAACPVIVATEMLHSMIQNPLPTKAEASDITNAVLDGASALTLSAETSVGKCPVESVAMMRKIADTAAEHLQVQLARTNGRETDNVPEAMGEAIALICSHLEVTKIIAVTMSGYAARMVAARRPRQPIVAVTNNAATARQLNLLPGTKGVAVDIPFSRTSLDHIPRCLEALWRGGEVDDKDLLLVTAVGYPKSGNRMNLIQTHRVADLCESLGWKQASATGLGRTE